MPSLGSLLSYRLLNVRGAIIGIVALLLCFSVLFVLWRSQTSNPIPIAVQESVTYPLYYPTELPPGYQIDQFSFQANNQVVLYSLTKQGSPSIAVSIQARPNGFDFDDFNNKQLRGSKAIANDAGDGLVGLYADRILGSLLTDKSWVLVNAPSKVPAKDIEMVMESLRSD